MQAIDYVQHFNKHKLATSHIHNKAVVQIGYAQLINIDTMYSLSGMLTIQKFSE